MGLQFQNLVLNNLKLIVNKLEIRPEDIIFLNPFFQEKTITIAGCQIDLLIQTKFNCLYICEIKFHKSPLTSSIIEEVKQKIHRIKMPKNYSYRPVMIHVNGVVDTVIEEGYFLHSIDFSELLE